jgi:hypothetical protein
MEIQLWSIQGAVRMTLTSMAIRAGERSVDGLVNLAERGEGGSRWVGQRVRQARRGRTVR